MNRAKYMVFTCLMILFSSCISENKINIPQEVYDKEQKAIEIIKKLHSNASIYKDDNDLVYKVSLDSLTNGEVPTELQLFDSLKILLMDGNLSDLPNWISELRLIQIYLGDNDFESFPKQLLKMNSLEAIQLRNNPIEIIDDTLYFPNLKVLYMPVTKITKFPIIKQDPNSPAIYFHLAETAIDSIPDEISSMKIKKIWMTDCNQLTYISPNLGKQDSLEELNFSFNAEFGTAFYNRNSIPRTIPIPEEIRDCKNLKNLDLEYNELTSIPDYVFEIPSLEVLGFRGNKISEIPEKISKLQKLRRIYVTNNQLRNLPKSFGQMPNLETISVWGNAISKENLPVEMFDISREKKCYLHLYMFYDKSFEGLPVSQEQFEKGYEWY
ncbi:leucine-rich repeat domain-containing protein [Persicobacter psychrovividus]|uniref:Leucine-rich repeat domain-containing protein n=1 Tax=Persicobacter psychrovividus TaxID=387638 RepID=A0ABN6LIA9_9BACT|nr:hypothetical protein PEPS_36140 [Persicobacter psychrovividus]